MGSDYPAGVIVVDLEPHEDHRGSVMELFTSAWDIPFAPAQWNAVRNEPGTLRGVHVHYDHVDYLTVPVGSAHIALVDMRAASSTADLSVVLDLGEKQPKAILIPPGVAHGFYFPDAAIHVYAMSQPWDPDDDDGCRWDDPDLGLDWQVGPSPLLSDRDAWAGSKSELIEKVRSRGL
jgi:dTDP-4-dehydrorhamnose 3,5-epimerase